MTCPPPVLSRHLDMSAGTCACSDMSLGTCPREHLRGVHMTEARAVLVTGSTGGIGTATVRLLQSRGFTVYAGARGPAAFEPGVRVVPLDVADPESVAAAAKRVAGEVD